MKSTGIVRKVDELGRIVVPIELRRTLDIAEKDAVEIYVDGDKIILKKYVSSIEREEKEAAVRELQNLGNQLGNQNIQDAISRVINYVK